MMLIAAVILALAVAVCGEPTDPAAEPQGLSTSCVIGYKGVRAAVSCWRAQFSPQWFEIHGLLEVLNSDLCSENDAMQCRSDHIKRVAWTRRGGCTFSVKAANAARLGFSALMVANNASTLFTIGSSNSTYTSSIPVVSVGANILSALASFETMEQASRSLMSSSDSPLLVSLTVSRIEPAIAVEGNAESWVRVGGRLWLGLVGAAMLGSLYLSLPRAAYQPASSSPSRGGFPLVIAFAGVAIVLLFVVVRLITLRRVHAAVLTRRGAEGTLLKDFNHFETDEQIFESLVRSVSADWTQYHLLSSSILQHLQLPKENYGHSLFIHPPLFVALSLGLHRLGLPLPAVPVLLQTLTLLCVPLIALEVTKASRWSHRAPAVALKAMLLYAVCPIAALSSQKFWLDNALVFATTLATVTHVWCSRRRAPWRVGLSGLFFGGVVLNTKVTGWAQLPFLLAWSLLKRLQQRPPGWGAWVLWAKDSVIFLLGAALGHGPWMYLYKARTGRWLPNAWPSADLVERFPFLQTALSRAPMHYLTLLCRIHPAYVAGLGLFVMSLSHFLRASAKSKALQLNPILVLASHPVAFLVGLSLVGALGGGFQARFLLPALPPLAILTAVAFVSIEDHIGEPGQVLFSLCVAVAAIHCFAYMIAAPLHADVDADIFQLLASMLGTRLPAPPQNQGEQQLLASQLRYYGVVHE